MAEGRPRRGRVESVVRPKEYRGEAKAWLGEADFEAEARTGQNRPCQESPRPPRRVRGESM